jgi:hypothetical protein
LFTIVCSTFANAASPRTAPPDPAAEKGSAAAADKADGAGTGCVEQEGSVFEGDKPRKGAPLVIAAAVVLVVAAVYFLALKKPKTVDTLLQVNSVPDGALIYLDGRDTGKLTNHTFSNMTPGSHNVKLTRSGYEDFSTTVIVLKGQTAVVNSTLTPSL